MNIKLQEVVNNINNKKIILTALGVCAFVVFILSIQLLAAALNYDKIYKGIYINDVYVSGMTPKEAEVFIRKIYEPKLKDMKILIKTDNAQQKIEPKNIVEALNIDDAVQKAFEQGRTGGSIYRIFSIADTAIHKKTFNLKYDYNEAKVQQLIGKFALKVKKDLIQSSYQIDEDKVILKTGVHGESIDEGALRQKLIDMINNFEEGGLEVPILITKPNPIDIDELHKEIYTKAEDAVYSVKDRSLIITPQVIGRDFDVEQAKELMKLHQKEGSTIEIKIKLTYPELYEQELEDSLLKQSLSSFSTRYNQGEKDRSENIRLAASKINGVVLAPGEIFSYNDIVGKRTMEEGYKKAHVYVRGKVVDGIGGGICQVSTTLYNAVLFADLEVVERRNHNMIVGYVPPGRDATVSYGSTDFKFKNNYKNPIKILTSTGGGKLNIEILGTKEKPNKKVELYTDVIESYSLKEKVIEDPSQPIGYYKVVQKGLKAYTVNTYKIIKENGKVISKKLISKNKYNPLQRIVKKGTKKQVNNTNQSSVTENTP